jgi:hypothetical protein
MSGGAGIIMLPQGNIMRNCLISRDVLFLRPMWAG